MNKQQDKDYRARKHHQSISYLHKSKSRLWRESQMDLGIPFYYWKIVSKINREIKTRGHSLVSNSQKQKKRWDGWAFGTGIAGQNFMQ